MSRENKGFRRRDAVRRDSQGLSGTLCVCSRLFELRRTCRLNGLARACLTSVYQRHECVTQEYIFMRACWFASLARPERRRKAKRAGFWNLRHGARRFVRVSWSMEAPRVPQAERFFFFPDKLAKRVCSLPGALLNLVSNSTSEGFDQCLSVWGWTKEEVWRGGSMSWGKTLFILRKES